MKKISEYTSKDGKFVHQAKAGRYGGSKPDVQKPVKGPSNKDLDKMKKEDLDEKAKPTDAALHKTLGPTKNYQQGVEALKKAHGFTSAQARGHVNRLMNQIAKADKLNKEEVEQVAELDDKTVKSYHQKAMKDTMLGKKDRNVGMSKALNRMSGLGKPLMKGPNEETVAEARYKMVDGKKMRWDDMKKMWTPVKDMFHTEQDKKETPPFDGPYKKVKSVVPGKQGEGPSTAKHLAKMGLKKFMAKDEKK